MSELPSDPISSFPFSKNCEFPSPSQAPCTQEEVLEEDTVINYGPASPLPSSGCDGFNSPDTKAELTSLYNAMRLGNGSVCNSYDNARNTEPVELSDQEDDGGDTNVTCGSGLSRSQTIADSVKFCSENFINLVDSTPPPIPVDKVVVELDVTSDDIPRSNTIEPVLEDDTRDNAFWNESDSLYSELAESPCFMSDIDGHRAKIYNTPYNPLQAVDDYGEFMNRAELFAGEALQGSAAITAIKCLDPRRVISLYAALIKRYSDLIGLETGTACNTQDALVIGLQAIVMDMTTGALELAINQELAHENSKPVNRSSKRDFSVTRTRDPLNITLLQATLHTKKAIDGQKKVARKTMGVFRDKFAGVGSTARPFPRPRHFHPYKNPGV